MYFHMVSHFPLIKINGDSIVKKEESNISKMTQN